MIITTLPETSFSYEDVAALMRKAFGQWEEAGLDSFLVHAEPEVIRAKTADSIVYVAVDGDLLAGTISMDIIPDQAGKHAFLKFLAIDPDCKGKGLASQLGRHAIADAEQSGCRYMLSDTAVHAKWAVRWHLKLGFRKIGYASFSTNSYYSYRFRRELGGHRGPSWLACSCQFVLSWLKVRTMKTRDGKPTTFSKLIHSVR